jgi:hypothetical protein
MEGLGIDGFDGPRAREALDPIELDAMPSMEMDGFVIQVTNLAACIRRRHRGARQF